MPEKLAVLASDVAGQPWTFSTFDFRGHGLRFAECGQGPVLLFQHGLGADCRQSLQALSPLAGAGFRIVALDCPGHGESPLAALDGKVGFARYVDVMMAFIEAMGLDGFAVGGISMGSGVMLGVAQRFLSAGRMQRIQAMVLVRPAWLDRPLPENLGLIGKLGRWIEEEGIEAASARLENEPAYRNLCAENPLCASSLRGVLSRPYARPHAPVLRQMFASRPVDSLAELAGLRLPALVVSNDADPLHPAPIAERLCRHLPWAELSHIASRYLEPERHHRELNAAAADFLGRFFHPGAAAKGPRLNPSTETNR